MSGETPYEYVYINDLSGGLNTVDSPVMLADNELQIARNVILTSRGSASKRDGFIEDSAYEIAGATGIKSGYRFYYGTSSTTVVQANESPNNKLYEYNRSSGYTEITGGTALGTNKIHYTDYKDWLFVFNGVQAQCWDGAGTKSDIVFYSDPAYLATKRNIRCMTVCDDRLFIVFEDEKYTVYYTEYGGWNTDPATDILIPLANYFNIPERSRDAAGIRGLKSFALADELLVLLTNDSYALLGVGATDYSLRKIAGEAGTINQDTIVEADDGTIYFMGNGKIFMTDGNAIYSIGDKIANLYSGVSLTNAFGVYDSINNLVLFFYPSGVLVWNISSSISNEPPVFGWSTWDLGADCVIRYTSATDNNKIVISRSGETKLYTLGTSSDDGDDIRFTIKTKCFDLGQFAEKKHFRGIKVLQDVNNEKPFDVVLHIDDNHKTATVPMELPYGGELWGQSLGWGATVWNGSSRINGSVIIPGNMWGYEFTVTIDNDDTNFVQIHRIAVELFARNRDRTKID